MQRTRPAPSPAVPRGASGSRGVARQPPAYGVATVDVVQRKGEGDPAGVRESAALGLRAPARGLPFLDHLQRAFGRNDLGNVVAHVGPEATAGAHSMGAAAYATGNHVVFGQSPSLHTVAHEVTHVLQQQRGVQLEGGVGRVGDAYERQADAVADAVVRGDSVASLFTGSRVETSGSTAVQRVPLTTSGGVWNTTTYTAWGPGRPDPTSDPGIGAEIALTFTPGSAVPRKVKVGLIQTVTALAGDRPDPTGSEAVALDEHGTTIDRDRGDAAPNTNPVYGAHNTAKVTATKLKHQVPETGENTWGMRYWVGANKAAKLWDKPSSAIDHRGSIAKTFETAAVVLEGKRKGTWLGSVSWGYRRAAGSRAAPTLDPVAIVSDGTPSAAFARAGRAWNAAGTNGGKALVPVPVPDEE